MSIEAIRLSEKEKQQLITLKRRTGILHWNILCRWAFCVSLAEPSPPPVESIPSDSTVEINWKTFSGSASATYLALLRERASRDGVVLLDSQQELGYFRLHLHRGISYLANHASFTLTRLLHGLDPDSPSEP